MAIVTSTLFLVNFSGNVTILDTTHRVKIQANFLPSAARFWEEKPATKQTSKKPIFSLLHRVSYWVNYLLSDLGQDRAQKALS